MKHRLFNILSAVSLLLALAVAGLWVRSYWRGDILLVRTARYSQFLTITDRGSLYGGVGTYQPGLDDWHLTSIPLDTNSAPVMGFDEWDDSSTDYLGFRYWKTTRGGGACLRVPLWFIVMMTLVLPSLWAIPRIRRWRRDLRGLCLVCGYDLRASKDECPECGAKIAAVESKASVL
jgi:hypothetical protein